MAYSTSTPPSKLADQMMGNGALWSYRSVDPVATVRGALYITNALDLGMKAGDFVLSAETDQLAPMLGSISVVGTVVAAGATLYALT